jgi:predicted component of type VI protein secretion system
MHAEVVLTFRDEDGALCEVAIASRRFTIGRAADNDLVINIPGVSRRHAVIETYDDSVLAYDCQSEQGTLLNNAPLRGSASLCSGDLLTLGGACDITVKLRAPLDAPAPAKVGRPSPVPPHPPSSSGARSQFAHRPPRAESSGEQWSLQVSTPVVVAAAVILIIVVGGFLLASRKQSPQEGVRESSSQFNSSSNEADSARTPDVDGGARSITNSDAATVGEEELERASARVVQRLSGDDRPYAFPPDALRDITRQVEQYRQSNELRDAFIAMQRGARTVAAQSRAEGVSPDLVIYVALAASDGGRDPSATARAMIPQLRDLRTTFGGGDADGSLLVVAAYTYGAGSKKSHPLLDTIRRLVRNSFAERNVWHLRERGGLSDAAYNLVIRTLAVGVIAQAPRRYGVQAEPLVY